MELPVLRFTTSIADTPVLPIASDLGITETVLTASSEFPIALSKLSNSSLPLSYEVTEYQYSNPFITVVST